VKLYATFTTAPTQEFKEAADCPAGLFVIPIICTGYVFPRKIVNGRVTAYSDFQTWWPKSMPQLKDHSLFVNLQNRAEWRSRVDLELLPAINSFLAGTVHVPVRVPVHAFIYPPSCSRTVFLV